MDRSSPQARLNRRSYLALSSGALAGLTGLAGCLGGEDSQSPPWPPYADAIFDYETDGSNPVTHSFSGSGDPDSDDPQSIDSFELSTDGPIIAEYDHEGEGRFNVGVLDSAGEVLAAGINAVGPFDGRTIHSIDPQTVELTVIADGEWTIDVTELPVYDTGESPPVERESTLTDVFGPIEFPDDAETQFTLSASGGGGHLVDVFDRAGEYSGLRLFATESDVDGETRTEQVSGVGYLLVESGGEWTVSIEHG